MLAGAGTIGPMEIGDDVMWIWGVVAIAFVVLVLALTWVATLWGRYTRPEDDDREGRERHSDGDTLPKAA
jgi:hypothetical protein